MGIGALTKRGLSPWDRLKSNNIRNGWKVIEGTVPVLLGPLRTKRGLSPWDRFGSSNIRNGWKVTEGTVPVLLEP
jgi:hypothetical protein